MNDKIIDLSWDSEFFGFPVSKIENVTLSKTFLKSVHLICKAKLIYYYNDEALDEKLFDNSFYEVKLVDIKVPLKKVLDKETNIHPNISFYQETEAGKELIELAQIAGVHTRFNIDGNIPKVKYRDLFTEWIERSVKKEIADFILVYKINNKIVGFAIIDIRQNSPYISLFAVHPDYEGKGISFALMRAIENKLRDLGYKEVFGATQQVNRKALVVYERYGLKRLPSQYVYHLWKRDNL